MRSICKGPGYALAFWQNIGRFVFSLSSISLLNIKVSLVAVFFFSLTAYGESCRFAQVVYGSLPFQEVEMISRNPSVGLYRGADVTLRPWIEISEKAFIGVDQRGQVLNVLQLKTRTVAFLLSGEQKFKEVFFLPPGDLLAIDQNGEIFQFNRPFWEQSPVQDIVFKALRNSGVAICSVGLALTTYSLAWGDSLFAPEILGSLGLGSISAIMIEAFRASTRFEYQNEKTNGFVSTGLKLKDFRRSDFVRDSNGQIVDYNLNVGGKELSLMNLIGWKIKRTDKADFDVLCEHELLPRGIPPREYEPSW